MSNDKKESEIKSNFGNGKIGYAALEQSDKFNYRNDIDCEGSNLRELRRHYMHGHEENVC